MNKLPISFLLVLALLTSCAQTASQNESLYSRLGELAGITRITDFFLAELADNENVIALFLDTDIERFREKLIEQLCFVADGPCDYTGDTMPDVHRGMNIDHAQFNSVVEDLIHAMERQGVPTGAQNALLQRLALMHEDIRELGDT